MTIEPIGAVSRVEASSPVERWWSIEQIPPVGALDSAHPVEAPLERDARAEALQIAQHATAFIPVPLMHSPPSRRRMPR